MKKIFTILLCLSTILIPIKAEASSYQYNYYCDSKEKLDDGTFYMTCHLILTTDFNVNHVAGQLILENVTLEQIKTNSDWVSNNGLSTNLDFKSKTTHSGTFTIADFTFTGDLSDTECTANFSPEVPELITTKPTPDPTPQEPTNPSCEIVDGEYYDEDGNKITEEKYYEKCFNYVCTVVDDKYYYNSEGKSVSYDKFLEDCSTNVPETPETGINYGLIVLPLGLLSIIGITKFIKKNTKIYKI